MTNQIRIRTIQDFRKHFPNEEACAHLLKQTKWPDGFKCPKCGNTQAYYITKRKVLNLPHEITCEQLPEQNGPVPPVIRAAFRANNKKLSEEAEYFFNLNAEYIPGDIGWEFWKTEGNPLPDRTIELLKETDCCLFGAITSKPNEDAQKELIPELRNKV